ncbi:MAG: hypothetical protein NUV46_02075 [Nanoarchaeota archaeon]|nr:hypothetical protein [Nanoarchaeota archaeon]
MTTLEKVLELKKMGIPESEIQIRLKNEGVSPMEINDAMNQSKIKEAVSGEREYSRIGMVPSIMGGAQDEENNSENEETYSPAPSPNEGSPESPQMRRNEYPGYARDYEEEPAEEEYYQENSVEGYEPGSGRVDSETMIEVAEQVFFEKIKDIEKELRNLKEFKTISAPIIEDLNERIKRIEKNFDKMQIAILEKVGSFGRNIDSLKKEVEMVEDSFEKMNKNKK